MANGRRANTAGSLTVSPVRGLTLAGKSVGPMRPSGRETAVGGAGDAVGSALTEPSSTTTTGGGARVGTGRGGGVDGSSDPGLLIVTTGVTATGTVTSVDVGWQLINKSDNNKIRRSAIKSRRFVDMKPPIQFLPTIILGRGREARQEWRR